jgi:maltose O-acetyltransferase
VRSQFKKIIKKMLGIKSPDQIEILKKKGLQVGKNFLMREGCIIDYSHAWHIKIGDDVMLGPRVHILAHDAATWMHLGYTKVRNTTIGDRVFIGASSILLPGITIGNDVIIGAGSLVTKDIPDNCIYTGNPAKYRMATDAYMDFEKRNMNAENCFGREYSEAENVTAEMKEHIKQMVQEHGTAFVK